jgi:hypothetical protein
MASAIPKLSGKSCRPPMAVMMMPLGVEQSDAGG